MYLLITMIMWSKAKSLIVELISPHVFVIIFKKIRFVLTNTLRCPLTTFLTFFWNFLSFFHFYVIFFRFIICKANFIERKKYIKINCGVTFMFFFFYLFNFLLNETLIKETLTNIARCLFNISQKIIL